MYSCSIWHSSHSLGEQGRHPRKGWQCVTQTGEVSKGLGANVADPHRVPILATCVQEELEKEVLMESTPCSAMAQVSCVPRISRGACKGVILVTFDFESSGTCHQIHLPPVECW